MADRKPIGGEDLRDLLKASTLFDAGEGAYWAYLDETLEAEGARAAKDTDLVALFRADGKSWVIAMPRGIWTEWKKAVDEGRSFSGAALYEPKS